MSLGSRRRIFVRQKRRSGAAAALRTGGMLALGFAAAFGATVVAVAWPGDGPQTGTHAGVYHIPALRVAAVAKAHPGQ